MQEIESAGPVTAFMDLYDDFQGHNLSEVYSHSPGAINKGAHSVKLIGWGEENGINYWLAANSWGRYWGVNGTFRIKRGVNESGIESQVMAGLPQPRLPTFYP